MRGEELKSTGGTSKDLGRARLYQLRVKTLGICLDGLGITE
jgi:hypothetical protein